MQNITSLTKALLHVFIIVICSTGDLPECARLSGNNDVAMDDRDYQKALEDSAKDAKKLRQQQGKYVSVQAILSYISNTVV